jgi:hypothetical protein
MYQGLDLTAFKNDVIALARLIADGKRAIARQREIVAALENEDGVSSETIALARNVLSSFEGMQARRIALRNDLRARFAEIKSHE